MNNIVVLMFALSAAVTVRGQQLAPAGVDPTDIRVPIESKVVNGAPYSAEIFAESTQTLADGNRILRRLTGRIYRDSAGRVRREEDRASGSPSISITDPVAGVSFSLDPERRLAWSSPTKAVKIEIKKVLRKKVDALNVEKTKAEQRKAEVMAAKLAGARVEAGRIGEQHAEETLPDRLIEGVRAQGHRRTTTVPIGAIGNERPITIVSEEWASPDLQVLVMTSRTDPRLGKSTYRLTNIIQGEPDPSMFEVPPDYTVRGTKTGKLQLAPRK